MDPDPNPVTEIFALVGSRAGTSFELFKQSNPGKVQHIIKLGSKQRSVIIYILPSSVPDR